ncbi:hypothetical protein FRC04_010295 [Tulasnella sp. 424]|nr:hypothetical protein FRC04_010295 [Tulasnella sp. 424]KAG8972677.1 hypothetical protein FRC05_009688 [Tulasnella sp. 425]
MAPFVLKFKGNKSFSPFSNLADGDALAKTWKVCTKVAAHLEQGQRLENLSWRLWHLQNLMVDNDNAKSRREFKKLSKHMGERLDKDKGRSIEELEVPDFKPDGTSLGKIKRRAEEKEQRGRTGMKGMTFTFPVDPATNSTPGATAPVSMKKQPLPLHQKAAHHGDLGMEDPLRTGGLTIDTQLGSPAAGENAPTPTGSSVPVNRTHYRGHHDSISSVSSDIYNTSQFTAPSPPTSNTSSGNGINGVALTSSQGQSQQSQQQQPNVIRFPNIFDDGFGPVALLCPSPTVKQNCTYGEAIGFAGLSSSTNHADVFSIQRPTFEFPLDELMTGDGSDAGSTTGYDSTSNLTNSVSSLSIPTPVSASMASFRELQITHVFGHGEAMQGVQATGLAMSKDLGGHHQPIVVDADLDGDELIRKSPPLIPSQSAPASPAVFPASNTNATTNNGTNAPAFPFPAASSPTDSFQIPPPLSLPKGATLPGPSPTPTPAPTSSSGSGAPHRLPRRYSTTNAPPHTSSGSSDATATGGSGKKGRHGPSATATAPRTIRSSYGNSAPGGVKSECANCGANSTPLWRRGLNDELNCNACGLFAKLHKRPRPKSLRNSNGEGGSRNPGWASSRNGDETVSCYNCGTVATPLWRKDEDGRTLCNALKLHGEKRPSSMKSDVIRKRSRTDARRGTSSSATPSASPGASRRTSPTPPMVTQPADNGNFPQSHNGQQQPVDHQSPYGQASSASYDAFGNGNGSQGQDNSPVDLMSMSHSMVSDAGVDPSASALGGMTFSPGLTYTETLHYPGPLSLSYYQAQYGMPPELTVPPDPSTQGQQGVQVGPQQQPVQSPSLQGVGSPRGAGGLFGGAAGLGGNGDAAPSVWDAQFQLPFTSNYSFGFGAAMAAGGGDGSNNNNNNNGGNNNAFGENAGLGVVHPPMLPTWYSSTPGAEAAATKTEPDHEISFGHH